MSFTHCIANAKTDKCKTRGDDEPQLYSLGETHPVYQSFSILSLSLSNDRPRNLPAIECNIFSSVGHSDYLTINELNLVYREDMTSRFKSTQFQSMRGSDDR